MPGRSRPGDRTSRGRTFRGRLLFDCQGPLVLMSVRQMEDLNARVAIAALVRRDEQAELQRRPRIALHDHTCAWGKHRLQRSNELWSKSSRLAVWGIQEHQIVLTSVNFCIAEEWQRPLVKNLRRDAQSRNVAPDGSDRRRRGVNEGGVARAP